MEGFQLQLILSSSLGGTARQVGLQNSLAGYRTAARATAAMRCGKGFMQIEMHHIEAHIAGAHDPHDGVKVGAVLVVQPAGLMNDIGDL